MALKPIAIKYGTSPIDFYEIRLGHNYKIQLMDLEGVVLTIPLKVYFGIGRAEKYKLYESILNTLWDHHFEELQESISNEFNQGKSINFGDKYVLAPEGLHINSRQQFIPFELMSISDRFDHLVVDHLTEKKVYTNIYYLEVWNSSILYQMLHSIVKLNG